MKINLKPNQFNKYLLKLQITKIQEILNISISFFF